MFIVEGNIGAGKTTFLKLIEKYFPNITVVFEPVKNWQKMVSGQSILENFYKDPTRWAYTMETATMISRVEEHIKEQENNNKLKFLERSIYSGHYCFGRNSYQNGFLSKIEWNMYVQWFNFLTKDKCKLPNGFIYLKVDPKVAYDRIKIRNRDAEKEISFDYIKQIDNWHEDFLINKVNISQELKNVPTLILDCNNDFEHDESEFLKHIDKIKTFLKNII